MNQSELITKVLSLYTLSEIFQLKVRKGLAELQVTEIDLLYSSSTGCGWIESGHVALVPVFKKNNNKKNTKL